jgi:hypothetical protein
MFCPKCHSEFQEGITTCVDCEVGLVKHRPVEDKPEYVSFVTVYETGKVVGFSKALPPAGDPQTLSKK